MNKTKGFFLCFCLPASVVAAGALILLCSVVAVWSDLPADYEGFGTVTQGAKDDPDGWEVYHVTTLDDSEYVKGSLKYAVFRWAGQTKGQYIVFDVAGTIRLGTNYRLKTKQSYTTIDGSTAPYPGITFDTAIRDEEGVPYSSLEFVIEPTDSGGSAGPAHDIIVNNIRFLGPGKDFSKDLLGINAADNSVYNVIFDHNTIDAAGDGIFDIGGDVSDVTVSWNLITGTNVASAVSGDAGSVQGISMHHNVWAKNSERQPKIKSKSTSVDLVNNVCYGWGWIESGGKGLQLEPHDSWETDKNYTVGVRRKYGDHVYVCLVEHISDEDGPPHEEPDTNVIDWEVTGIVPDDIPAVNIIGNNYHYVNGQGVDYWGLKRTNAKGELCVGQIYFEDNIFPAIEDEDYSTSARHVIPAYAEVTKYDANTLGDTVVPYVGTHYPTAEEQALLNEISLAIGGQGLGVQSSWQPPIGIPRPEFGIEETYRMYDDPSKRNPSLTYTQNSEGGYYTHYVDSTHPNATNTDNPYGTPSKPRLTIPYPLIEGSVVEVHGGPYTYQQGGAVRIKGWTGTSSKPIFVRGTVTENHPYFTYSFSIEGEYVILENLSGKGASIRGEFAGEDRDSNYISVRSCDFYSTVEGPGGIVAQDTGNVLYDVESNYVVIYNNKVHDFGDLDLDEDQDYGGIAATCDEVWIVDNEVYNTSGSGMQFAGPDSNGIYVGRNHIHDCRQAGIAYKRGSNHVYSQNTIHDIIHTSWSPSKGINLQYGEGPVWVIFNEIYNTVGGINAGDTRGTPADSYFYIIGNLIYDTVSISEAIEPLSYSQEWIDAQEAIGWKGISFWQLGNFYIISNTIDGYRGGIYSGGSIAESLGGKVFNNIVTNTTLSYHFDTNVGGTYGCVVENNLFWQGEEDISLSWGNSDYTTIAAFQSASDTGDNCLKADPLFTDSGNDDFTLQSASPAIDVGKSDGIVATVFNLYQSTFGVDIRKDIEGGVRPYGAGWDIGAYEWNSTPAEPDQKPEPEPKPEPEAEPEAEPEVLIPDVTALLVMNNIIKSGGNQTASIRCDMKEAGHLTVIIYDAKGRKITVLCDEYREAGTHEFVWTGKDSAGSTVGSGIYLVHMKSGGYSKTAKIAIVK